MSSRSAESSATSKAEGLRSERSERSGAGAKRSGLAGYEVDVGRGANIYIYIYIIVVQWIWISTTKPQ